MSRSWKSVVALVLIGAMATVLFSAGIALAGAPPKLLIITDESFLPTMQPLKEWKDSSGMPTILVTWQDVVQTYQPSGRDDPERIKKAIADYYTNSNVRYVMLVGDMDKFPVRYIQFDYREVEKTSEYKGTDLYYADLFRSDGSFSDWDGDQDGYFGEVRGESQPGIVNYDGIDLVPDVGVGRVAVSTQSEAQTYVDKVIKYESTSYGADWTNQVVSVATDEWVSWAPAWMDDRCANELANFSVTKLHSGGTTLPGDVTMQTALNAGAVFLSYVGHGYTGGFQMNAGGWYNTETILHDSSGVPLKNADKLPVIFSTACDTAQWVISSAHHSYRDTSGADCVPKSDPAFPPLPVQPSMYDVDSFAEKMLFGQADGAIGYIGSHSFSQNRGLDLQKPFLAGLDKGKVLGDVWSGAVTSYYISFPPGVVTSPTGDWPVSQEFITPWKFNLLGDPSLRIGGVSPADINEPPSLSVDPTQQTVQYSDPTIQGLASVADEDGPHYDFLTHSAFPAGIAQISAVSNATPIPGTDRTSGSGSMTFGGKMGEPAGEYKVVFSATDGFWSKTATTTYQVKPEDSWIASLDTPDAPVMVGGTVTVKGKVAQIQDGSLGDITRAKVHLTLVPVAPGSPVEADASVAADGSFTYTFSGLGVNCYSVLAKIDGGYFASKTVEGLLTVCDPGAGFVSGGGWFYWPGTTHKTNFGFVMKYGKSGTTPKGSLIVIRHTPCGDYRLKSNALSGFGVSQGSDAGGSFGWTSFTGKATFGALLAEPIGNYSFSVYAEDRNGPGDGRDRFWLSVKKDGAAAWPLTMSPTASGWVALEGGNISIPHQAK